MNIKPKRKPSIYDLASKEYDFFMAWAEANLMPLPSAPSYEYIQKKYSEYLKEKNIDEYGNKLPSSEP